MILDRLLFWYLLLLLLLFHLCSLFDDIRHICCICGSLTFFLLRRGRGCARSAAAIVVAVIVAAATAAATAVWPLKFFRPYNR